jgi:hypothetical protein
MNNPKTTLIVCMCLLCVLASSEDAVENETIVRGTIVDTSGTPVPSLSISLRPYGLEKSAHYGEDGTFQIELRSGGTFDVLVETDSDKENIYIPVRSIVKGSELSVNTGETLEGFHVVVQVIPHVRGRITGTEGETPSPKVRAFPTTKYDNDRWTQHNSCLPRGAHATRFGYFASWYGKDYVGGPDHFCPYLIEITCDGYKTRILELGRDFGPEDHNVEVILEKGPFGKGESVFAYVTGREPTVQEVEDMPHATTLRYWETRYRHLAAIGRVPKDAPHPIWRTHGSSHSVQIPNPARSWFDIVNAGDGDLSSTNWIRVVSTKRETVHMLYAQWAAQKPIRGDSATMPFKIREDSPLRTFESTEGLFVVPNNCFVWTPGYEKIFVPAVSETQRGIRTITLNAESASPPTNEAKPSSINKVPAITASEILEELSGKNINSKEEYQRMQELVVAIRMLASSDATPLIQSILEQWKPDGRGWTPHDDGWDAMDGKIHEYVLPAVLANLLAELQGDSEVDYFYDLAENNKWLYHIRSAAIVALGRIGTKKSIAAFTELRDKARSFPDAPQQKESYTHAERICEATNMALKFMPGPSRSEMGFGANTSSVHVSQNYQRGTVIFSIGSARKEITLRRFSSEWVVVEIGSTTRFPTTIL